MGNAASSIQSSSTQTPEGELKQHLQYMQTDLPKFILASKLSTGKFMKTYIMRGGGSPILVKVYMAKPQPHPPSSSSSSSTTNPPLIIGAGPASGVIISSPTGTTIGASGGEEDLLPQARELTRLLCVLSPSKYPNLMPYQIFMRSNSASALRQKPSTAPVYLIRQYFNTNLNDRISTRPFFNDIEKKWIIFQIFKCLEICHEHGLPHGDIKLDNLMCTSSNWLVLTDFSSFKPVCIPDDDPTNFQYYFDPLSHNKCYLAPERFYKRAVGRSQNTSAVPATEDQNGQSPVSSGIRKAYEHEVANDVLLPSMDIFSLGCAIAEIFLDGTPLFDLPTMLKYLTSSAPALGPVVDLENIGKFSDGNSTSSTASNSFKAGEEEDSKQIIMRISDPLLRSVLIHMTQKDASKRLTASQYLKILLDQSDSSDPSESKASTLPSYLENSVYPLYLKLHWNGVTPDDRINIICESYAEIISSITQTQDEEGVEFFNLMIENSGRCLSSLFSLETRHSLLLLPSVAQVLKSSTQDNSSNYDTSILRKARKDVESISKLTDSVPTTSFSNLDELLELAENQMNDINNFLSYIENSSSEELAAENNPIGEDLASMEDNNDDNLDENLLNKLKNKDFFSTSFHSLEEKRPSYDGLVLIITLLTSNYRQLMLSSSRITCLMLLTRLGRLCSDAVILQRIVPFLLLGLEDSFASVRVTSLRSLVCLLSLVNEFDDLEVNYFPQYIFPSLSKLVKDTDLIVRMTFAQTLGTIAIVSKKFLDKGYMDFYNKAIRSNGTTDSVSSPQLSEVNDKFLIENPYIQNLEHIKEPVSRWIRDLIIDSSYSNISSHSNSSSSDNYHKQTKFSTVINFDSSVKKVLLSQIMEFCLFFGQESTMEKLLTQLLTFLNDQDWELRSTFCLKIPAVGAFLGSTVTSEYIVPCLENTIYDVEERVSLSTIYAISSLIKLNLVSKKLVYEFINRCKALLIHPSQSLRRATMYLLSCSSDALGTVDCAVFLLPQIKPFLKNDVILSPDNITLSTLSTALISPLNDFILRNELLRHLKDISNKPSNSLKFSNIFFSSVVSTGKIIGASGQAYDYEDEDDEIVCSSENLSEDEAYRVSLVNDYLQAAAKEIYIKTLRWRNQTNPTDSTNRSSNIRGSIFNQPSISSSLSRTPNDSSVYLNFNMFDHAINSIQIPLTKFAPSISEELRKRPIYLDNDEQRNQQKIRTLFLGFSGSDRIITSVEPEDYSSPTNTTASVTISSSNATNSVGMPSSSSTQNPYQVSSTLIPSSKYGFSTMNSLAILRRFRALKVPPLPIDMGGNTQSQSNEDNTTYNQGSSNSVNLGNIDPSTPTSAPGNLSDGSRATSNWRPKEGVLVTTLREHSSSVNRVVVSPDQSFFATASSDGTIRVWQSKNIEKVAFPRSVCMYGGHKAAITDAVPIENSHSIASCSKDGSVHVWRVDLATSNPPQNNHDSYSSTYSSSYSNPNASVINGTSVLRVVSPEEGPISAIQHFHHDVASIVTFATAKGGVHGWDLRQPKEAFKFQSRPELGYTSSMTVSPDRNWICVGYSKGYIGLFDIRYNIMSTLWRHSSKSVIHRLACSKAMKGSASSPQLLPGLPSTEGAYLFVATGNNEAAVWGLPEGGECFKCFRSLSLDDSKEAVASLPYLENISLPRMLDSPIYSTDSTLWPYSSSKGSLFQNFLNYNTSFTDDKFSNVFNSPSSYGQNPSSINNILPNTRENFMNVGNSVASHSSVFQHSVRAMIGRISSAHSSYLITAGTDRYIRYWDLKSPEGCFTFAGLQHAQPKSIYVTRKVSEEPYSQGQQNFGPSTRPSSGKLFVCYTSTTPSVDKILQSHLPIREGRGLSLSPPVPRDGIQDLKDLEMKSTGGRLLLSAGRDGEVKIWR